MNSPFLEFARSNFPRTNKRNPCPVCSDVSGKCGFSANEPIVFCGNADSGEANGYRFIKLAKNPLWGIFAPIEGENWKSNLTPIRPIQRIKTTAAKRKSIEERDRDYRAMPAELSASRRDNLLGRGLTSEEIDFAIANHWLWNFGKGFAIAASSLDGKIQGCQIAKDDRKPKYLWDSKDESGRLPDSDEMPLFLWIHPNCNFSQPIKLIACEGSLKPLVAALKHWRTKDYQTAFVGAAGGNFQPQELTKLLGGLKPASIQYAPDAGAIVNKSVMRTIAQFVDLITSLRIEPEFLWWGQRTKDENDIDETTQVELESAQLLTWEEFQALSEFGAEEKQNQSEGDERGKQRDRLINKRVFRFRQYQEQLQRDFLLPTLVNGDEIRYRNYQGYAPVFDLFSDTTCLQGWLGAGKTEAMLKSLIPFQDKAIVWVAPRNGLLRQTAQRAREFGFNVFHYQDDPGIHRMMLEAGTPGIYFMAPDSFKTYAVSDVQWENTIFAIDEFSGIRKEILGKTAELPQILNAIEKCGSLLVADAFLSQVDIRVIQKHRNGSMQILRQDFKKSPTRIKWLECRNKADEVSFSHEGLYYSLLDRWIDEGLGRIAIAVDSIHVAKMLDRYLKSKGVKTWIVCSETPQENHSFMEEPDNIIEHGKIQAVIYTPTAQSGLDIQAKFDRGLLVCTGTLPPVQMLQMLGRCRQCPKWYVSAPRYSGNPDCVTLSLEGKKIRQWSEQITQMASDHGFNSPESIQSWAVWEELTRNIEKAFTSEYVRFLLDYFFESVEMIEIEKDLMKHRVKHWRRDSRILKSEDAEKTLKADLSNGLSLIDEQKQPRLNSEVWDVKLGQFWLKYPKVANKAISDVESSEVEARQANAEIYKLGGSDAVLTKIEQLERQICNRDFEIERWQERLDVTRRIVDQDPSSENLRLRAEIREELMAELEQRSEDKAEHERLIQLLRGTQAEKASEAVEMTKLFHSRRVEKLKNYVIATEPNEQDDRDLLQYLRERPTHYNAGNFKRLQNLKLFRALNLGALACVSDVEELEAGVNAFRASSDAIANLYRQFQTNSELVRFFPLIDSQKAFFDAIKACLSYLGYERGGQSIRVETEELNPNGKDRNGNQRFSKSKSIYFVYWLVMQASGSAYFRENLELILQAIRDRLENEREERQRRREQKERYESPPPGWEAQAA